MIHPQKPEPTRSQTLRQLALPTTALICAAIMAAQQWFS